MEYYLRSTPRLTHKIGTGLCYPELRALYGGIGIAFAGYEPHGRPQLHTRAPRQSMAFAQQNIIQFLSFAE